jgi:EAL domain-containing protein (putative c-di-GMP-specific phosphodiesterase class I)
MKRLPVDVLKIDKSFVLEMAVDEKDAAIVRSTIGLASHPLAHVPPNLLRALAAR